MYVCIYYSLADSSTRSHTRKDLTPVGHTPKPSTLGTTVTVTQTLHGGRHLRTHLIIGFGFGFGFGVRVRVRVMAMVRVTLTPTLTLALTPTLTSARTHSHTHTRPHLTHLLRMT